MRKSFNIFAAVTVTALAFSLAGQPVQAATYTWKTSGTTGNTNWSTASNWVGGTAAASNAASTTIQFTSNLGGGSANTNSATNFSLNQLLINGTTSYNTTGNLFFGSGGAINNTSTVLQKLPNLNATVAGFSVTTTNNTLQIANLLGSGTVTFNGPGQNIVDSSSGPGIVNNSGSLTLPFFASYGLTANGGTIYTSDSGFATNGAFVGSSAALMYMVTGTDMQSSVAGPVDYNGLNVSLNLDFLADTLGQAPETFWSTLFSGGDSYTGNLGSLVSTATSGPYVGLTWSQLGSGVWQSSVYNTNQQLEFRPTEGTIYVVPEPTQMVFVAGVAAAFGAWRMRKLRRNGRGSNTTAC
jgi:hypothetical protein